MLSVGIVGLPNVGKSSLFNTLTGTNANSENYPFCTISPNIGIASVKDKRLLEIAKVAKSKNIVHATVKFTDIAGLVKGASEGAGLGNKFLSDIRDTQAIVHVVRCFKNKDITHVLGDINPLEDISIINNEIILSDISCIENAISRIKNRSGTNDIDQKRNTLNKVLECLYAEIPARNMKLSEEERKIADNYRLLSSKPMIYAANYSNMEEDKNLLKKTRDYLLKRQEKLIEINSLEEYSDKNQTLDDLVYASYKSLGLLTYFTAGEKEARAWTVRSGSNAEESASVIHTDIQRGFIRAEVTSFQEYIEHIKNSSNKKTKRVRLEGKKYIVQDGDVILFRFNV